MFNQGSSGAPPSRRLRTGFLAVGVLFACVLLVVSITGFLRARALAETVTRGQAGLIRSSVTAFSRGSWPTQAQLEAKFAELEALELGPRYIGVLSFEHDDLPAVGQPSSLPSPHQLPALMHAGTLDLGDTVQVIAPLMLPPPPRTERQGQGPPPRGPQGRRGAPPRPRGHILVEFEPVMSVALAARSRRELATGLLGALVMLVISAAFWRLSLQAERAQQHLAEQQRLAALGEMSAVLAHELRNPLASLKGHAQLLVEQLERSETAPRIQRKATRVVDEALRLEQLSEGLLAFVRIGEIIREPASPLALVESAAADLEHTRVTIDASQAPPAWDLDGPRMRQVLTNLIANALQAAPEQPVEVSVSTREGALEFRVRDHGPGVPADVRARLFEPFVTTKTRGTGLGLAISRRIVELHEGEIGVEQHSEGGALFFVRIPGTNTP